MTTDCLPPLDLPDGPALELARLADERMVRLGWGKGFVQYARPEEGVWHVGGLWRLNLSASRLEVLEGWDWIRRQWRTERMGVSSETESRFPFVGWSSRTTPISIAAIFLKIAVDECLIDAVNAWEADRGEPSSTSARENALEALLKRWTGVGGALTRLKMARQVRQWKQEVASFFGKRFVNTVARVRRYRAFGLAHLVSAWPHRQALFEVANQHPHWLPLLNVIALPHWGSPLWKTGDGWRLLQARFETSEDRLILPWEKGLRWEQVDLPVFQTPERARAWLERSSRQADPRVWRSATDVYLYESALEQWRQQPWWPSGLPSSALANLQQVHSAFTDRLVETPPHEQVMAMVKGWAKRFAELKDHRWVYANLSREWDDLVEGLDQLKESRLLPEEWDELQQLPLRHPWVASDRSSHLTHRLNEASSTGEQGSGRARL